MNGHHDPNPTLPVDPDSAPPSPLHARASAIAAVGVGGLVGAPLRYQLGLWCSGGRGADSRNPALRIYGR